MKLKELFLSLSKNKQIVEIYCNEDNRDSIFGFKINHIDSVELEFDEVIDAIIDEINSAFIENTNLIENMEGTTSLLVQSDGKILKKAKYFDWKSGTDVLWIEENNSIFLIGKVELPFSFGVITKDNDMLTFSEESAFLQHLSYEKYNLFLGFYKDLLLSFQNIELELGFDLNAEGQTNCSINQIYGYYTEIINFTLLDDSKIDITNSKLSKILINKFDMNTKLISKILV